MSILDKVTKDSSTLVKFLWGTSNSLLLTDFPESLTVTPGTFQPESSISVELPDNSVFLSEQPAFIEVDINADSLFSDAASGLPHAKITVWVYEYLQNAAETESSTTAVYVGIVTIITKNIQDKGDIVRLEIRNEKHHFDAMIGIPAAHTCPWVLGDKNCQATVGTNNLNVNSINGSVISTTTIPARGNQYFNKGFAELDGLKLEILSWDNSSSFVLSREPPSSWNGSTVTFHGGCNKLVDTCRSRWNNEEHFAGLGFAMLPYNPNYELSN